MNIESISYDREVEALLAGAGLPVSDIAGTEHLQLFGMRSGPALVGVVGVEVYGQTGLLRSLAVAESHRAKGCGRALVRHAEAWASRRGVRALYLLTTTASRYFARHGYLELDRSEAPAAIATTTQFAGLCPASAVLMRKVLAANTLA